MKKNLSQLLPSLAYELVACDGKSSVDINEVADISVCGLAFDSRKVLPGFLFFAWAGDHTDGNSFIPDAIERGAVAIVYQGELSEEIKQKSAKLIVKKQMEDAFSKASKDFFPVFIKVKDSRKAMAPISASFYDFPSSRLVMIGVTGTEGKSSTVSFIWQLLRLLGKKAGFISTVEYSFGKDAVPNPEHQTTPESPVIQQYLSRMLENGCEYAVVESSSHGLSDKLNRLGNVLFDCAVFMNVTLEHLEFHKDFETYRNDKANLFRALDLHNHVKTIFGVEKKIPSIGIVNLEDKSASYFASATNKKIYGFMTENASPQKKDILESPKNISVMEGKNVKSTTDSLEFTVEAEGYSSCTDEIPYKTAEEKVSFSVRAKTPGTFNAHNIMASIIAVSSVTNIPFSTIAEKVPELKPIKGRMTSIKKGQDFELIVDYAHTPSSFEAVLPPLKKRCRGKLICLFGSGGERDREKRPLQGRLAARFCDVVFLSDEDPRGEEPEALLREIAEGAFAEGKKEGENLFIVPDRKKAIRKAFSLAKKDDIVILLGKSHENSIIYKDFVMPYDETSEAEKAIDEMKIK